MRISSPSSDQYSLDLSLFSSDLFPSIQVDLQSSFHVTLYRFEGQVVPCRREGSEVFFLREGGRVSNIDCLDGWEGGGGRGDVEECGGE